DKTGEVCILVGDVLRDIEHQHHHIGVLDRLQGFHHRELFDHVVDLAAAAYSSRVDQRIAPAAALEVDVNAVAGSTRLVECDHPLFAEQRIYQCGLADVRPADYCNLGMFGGFTG